MNSGIQAGHTHPGASALLWGRVYIYISREVRRGNGIVRREEGSPLTDFSESEEDLTLNKKKQLSM